MNDIDAKFIACVKANDLSATITLLKSGANVHARNDLALICSVENKNTNMISKLLEYNANIHADNDYALRMSARIGASNVMIKLLENDANINADNRHYFSALESGVFHNHLDVVTKLLEYGVDFHAGDDCSLQLSITYRRIEMTAKLLEYGANIYRNDKQILKDLQSIFNEEIADVILPYCDVSDYEYFPADYIKKRIIPTKNANTHTHKKID